MRCGKLSVQSCSLLWFLSSVCLVCTAQPKLAASRAAFHLIIRRPRVAGGTLTIALDSTVKFVKGLRKDIEHHIIRLQYGSNGKILTMRASSSQEREYWVAAITAAMSRSIHPRHGPASRTGNGSTIFQSFWTTKSQPTTYGAPTRGDSLLRRLVGQNIPEAMELVLTVGQIIAAVY
ncbi:unnamed protein product [Peronospora effusa]|nr:unnamed protein product [Peronospora effusa]